MKSIFYYSPRAYEAMIKAAHMGVYDGRLNALLSFIDGTSVLDLGCGTALMQECLCVPYLGIERNHRFVEYAKKKHRNVVEDDIFEFRKHLNGGKNTVLLMDVLHHLPDPEKLIEEIKSSDAYQIVVCEPYNMPDHPLHGNKILNRIFDSDGINGPTKWFDKKGLVDFYERHGFCDLTKIRNSIIARTRAAGKG